MQILVTGGAGYIGSHTAEKLLKAGFEVCVFDNLSTGFKEAVPAAAELVSGNVLDTALLSKVMREKQIKAVIHFAAKLNVAESLKMPLEYYDNNTNGVLSLTRACVENKIDKVVFSSTAAVYGDSTQAGTIVEEAPKAPLNPYGHSKLFSEQILVDAEKAYGLRTVRFRYFNVAGASDDGRNGQRTADAYHLVHLASKAAIGKRADLSIYGTDYPTPDGTCLRDYIHVEDLADVHVLGLKSLLDGGASDVFNCGYGHGYSVKEVIGAMKKASGVNFKVSETARRPGDPASLVANSNKLKQKLNWQPQRDNIEQICRSAFEWERKLNL